MASDSQGGAGGALGTVAALLNDLDNLRIRYISSGSAAKHPRHSSAQVIQQRARQAHGSNAGSPASVHRQPADRSRQHKANTPIQSSTNAVDSSPRVAAQRAERVRGLLHQLTPSKSPGRATNPSDASNTGTQPSVAPSPKQQAHAIHQASRARSQHMPYHPPQTGDAHSSGVVGGMMKVAPPPSPNMQDPAYDPPLLLQPEIEDRHSAEGQKTSFDTSLQQAAWHSYPPAQEPLSTAGPAVALVPPGSRHASPHEPHTSTMHMQQARPATPVPALPAGEYMLADLSPGSHQVVVTAQSSVHQRIDVYADGTVMTVHSPRPMPSPRRLDRDYPIDVPAQAWFQAPDTQQHSAATANNTQHASKPAPLLVDNTFKAIRQLTDGQAVQAARSGSHSQYQAAPQLNDVPYRSMRHHPAVMQPDMSASTLRQDVSQQVAAIEPPDAPAIVEHVQEHEQVQQAAAVTVVQAAPSPNTAMTPQTPASDAAVSPSNPAAQLRSKYKRAKRLLQLQQVEHSRMQGELHASQQAHAASQAQVEQLQQACMQLQGQLDAQQQVPTTPAGGHLESQVHAAEGEVAQLQQTLDSLQKAHGALLAAHDQSETAVRQQREHERSLQQAQDRIDQLQAEAHQAQQQLQQAQQFISQLQDLLHQRDEQVQHLQQTALVRVQEMQLTAEAQLSAAVQQAQKDAAVQLEKLKQQQDDRLRTIELQHAAMHHDMETQHAAALQKMEAVHAGELERRQSDVDSMLHHAQAQHSQAVAEQQASHSAALARAAQEHRDALSQLEKGHQVLMNAVEERYARQLATLRSEVRQASHDSELRALQQLQVAEEQVQQLQAQVQQLQVTEKQVQQLQGAEEQVQQLQAQVEQLQGAEEQVQQLQVEVEKLRGAEEQVQQLQAQVEQLQALQAADQDVHDAVVHALRQQLQAVEGQQHAPHLLAPVATAPISYQHDHADAAVSAADAQEGGAEGDQEVVVSQTAVPAQFTESTAVRREQAASPHSDLLNRLAAAQAALLAEQARNRELQAQVQAAPADLALVSPRSRKGSGLSISRLQVATHQQLGQAATRTAPAEAEIRAHTQEAVNLPDSAAQLLHTGDEHTEQAVPIEQPRRHEQTPASGQEQASEHHTAELEHVPCAPPGGSELQAAELEKSTLALPDEACPATQTELQNQLEQVQHQLAIKASQLDAVQQQLEVAHQVARLQAQLLEEQLDKLGQAWSQERSVLLAKLQAKQDEAAALLQQITTMPAEARPPVQSSTTQQVQLPAAEELPATSGDRTGLLCSQSTMVDKTDESAKAVSTAVQIEPPRIPQQQQQVPEVPDMAAASTTAAPAAHEELQPDSTALQRQEDEANKQLQLSLQQLQLQEADWVAERVQLQSSIAALQQELCTARQDAADSKGSMLQTDAARAALADELLATQLLMQGLQQQLQDLQAQAVQLTAVVQEHKQAQLNEQQARKAAEDLLALSEQARQGSEARVAELEDCVQQQTQLCTQMQAELNAAMEAAEAEVSQLQEQLKEAHGVAEQQALQVTQLNAAQAVLATDSHAAAKRFEAECVELRLQLQAAEAIAATAAQQHKAACSQLEAQLLHVREAAAVASEQHQEARAALEAELAAVRADAASATGQQRAARAARAAATSAAAELEQQQAAYAAVVAELADTKAEIAAAAGQQRAAHAARAAAAAAAAELEQLKAAYVALEAQLATATAQADPEADPQQMQIQALQEQLEAAQQAAAEARAEAVAAGGQQRAAHAARAAAVAAASELQQLKSAYAALEAEIAAANAQTATAADKHQLQYEELEAQLEAAQQAEVEGRAEVAAAGGQQRAAHAARAAAVAAASELEQLKVAYAALEADSAAVKAELGAAIHQHRLQCEALQGQLEAARKEVAVANEQLHTADHALPAQPAAAATPASSVAVDNEELMLRCEQLELAVAKAQQLANDRQAACQAQQAELVDARSLADQRQVECAGMQGRVQQLEQLVVEQEQQLLQLQSQLELAQTGPVMEAAPKMQAAHAVHVIAGTEDMLACATQPQPATNDSPADGDDRTGQQEQQPQELRNSGSTDMQHAMHKLEELQAELLQLRLSLQAKTEECQKLESMLQDMQQQQAANVGKMNELNRLLKAQLAESEQQVMQLKQVLNEHDTQLNAHQAQLQQHTVQGSGQKAELCDQHADGAVLQQAVHAAEAESEQVQERLSKARGECEKLQAELSASEAECASLRQRLAASQHTPSEHQAGVVTHELLQLRAAHEQALREIELLEEELAQVATHFKQQQASVADELKAVTRLCQEGLAGLAAEAATTGQALLSQLQQAAAEVASSQQALLARCLQAEQQVQQQAMARPPSCEAEHAQLQVHSSVSQPASPHGIPTEQLLDRQQQQVDSIADSSMLKASGSPMQACAAGAPGPQPSVPHTYDAGQLVLHVQGGVTQHTQSLNTNADLLSALEAAASAQAAADGLRVQLMASQQAAARVMALEMAQQEGVARVQHLEKQLADATQRCMDQEAELSRFTAQVDRLQRQLQQQAQVQAADTSRQQHQEHAAASQPQQQQLLEAQVHVQTLEAQLEHTHVRMLQAQAAEREARQHAEHVTSQLEAVQQQLQHQVDVAAELMLEKAKLEVRLGSLKPTPVGLAAIQGPGCGANEDGSVTAQQLTERLSGSSSQTAAGASTQGYEHPSSVDVDTPRRLSDTSDPPVLQQQQLAAGTAQDSRAVSMLQGEAVGRARLIPQANLQQGLGLSEVEQARNQLISGLQQVLYSPDCGPGMQDGGLAASSPDTSAPGGAGAAAFRSTSPLHTSSLAAAAGTPAVGAANSRSSASWLLEISHIVHPAAEATAVQPAHARQAGSATGADQAFQSSALAAQPALPADRVAARPTAGARQQQHATKASDTNAAAGTSRHLSRAARAAPAPHNTSSSRDARQQHGNAAVLRNVGAARTAQGEGGSGEGSLTLQQIDDALQGEMSILLDDIAAHVAHVRQVDAVLDVLEQHCTAANTCVPSQLQPLVSPSGLHMLQQLYTTVVLAQREVARVQRLLGDDVQLGVAAIMPDSGPAIQSKPQSSVTSSPGKAAAGAAYRQRVGYASLRNPRPQVHSNTTSDRRTDRHVSGQAGRQVSQVSWRAAFSARAASFEQLLQQAKTRIEAAIHSVQTILCAEQTSTSPHMPGVAAAIGQQSNRSTAAQNRSSTVNVFNSSRDSHDARLVATGISRSRPAEDEQAAPWQASLSLCRAPDPLGAPVLPVDVTASSSTYSSPRQQPPTWFGHQDHLSHSEEQEQPSRASMLRLSRLEHVAPTPQHTSIRTLATNALLQSQQQAERPLQSRQQARSAGAADAAQNRSGRDVTGPSSMMQPGSSGSNRTGALQHLKAIRKLGSELARMREGGDNP